MKGVGFDKRGGRVSGEVGAGIYASHEMYSMTIGVGEGGRECKGWLEGAGMVGGGRGRWQVAGGVRGDGSWQGV